MQEITTFLPCGVLVLNPESKLLSVNPFVCELMGYTADELIGKRIDVLLSTASRIYFQTHIYPLIALHSSASELYITLQTRQRAQIPVLLNATRHDQDGQLLTYLTFIPVHQRRLYEKEILTAKKTAEDALLRNDQLVQLQQRLEQNQAELDRQVNRLQQRNDELEQFSKIITHDLQEPLRKISIFASLLANEQTDALTPMGNSAIGGISKASGRLRSLINDLQIYFSVTSKQDVLKSIDIQAIVESIAQEYQSTGVLFDLKPLPAVAGNKESLTSLFRHLIDNAVKFRQSDDKPVRVQIDGTVIGHNRFRTTPNKYNYVNYARIIVSDNGIGFDNQQRDEIFRILKKLHHHTPGMGLGLAVSKKIVEWHDGQISAESAVGRGTRVTVLLPIA